MVTWDPSNIPTKIADVTLKDQRLNVDNTWFENVALDNCHLTYSGGPYTWINVKPNDRCTLELRGAARLTAELMNFFGVADDPIKQH